MALINTLQKRLKHWLVLFFSSLLAVILLGLSGQEAAESTMATMAVDVTTIDPLKTTETTATTTATILAAATDESISADIITVETGQLITDGIRAFEAGRFSEAIAAWQPALNATTAPLSQAYLFSNLASAYQQLGQASNAQSALAEGLLLLQDWPDPADITYREVFARVLNTQGQLQWQQGQTTAALESWQAAESYYRKVVDEPVQPSAQTEARSELNPEFRSGLIQTQINQALALQELGFNARAARQLNQLSQQISEFPSTLQLTVEMELCRAMRRVGELDGAKEMLTAVLEQETGLLLNTDGSNDDGANTVGSSDDSYKNSGGLNSGGLSEGNFNDSNESNGFNGSSGRRLAIAQIQLELGHTLRSLSHQEIALGKVADANREADLALSYYEQVVSLVEASTASGTVPATNTLTLLKTQAQLNQLSFSIEIGRTSAAQRRWPAIDLSVLPTGRESTAAYVSYAHSLNCLRSPMAKTCTKKEWLEGLSKRTSVEPLAMPTAESQMQTTLLQSLTTAVEQAKVLADPMMESYAVGELGHAYELSGQRREAIQLTQQALSLLEGRQMPEVRYRWEWQLGRLYRQLSAERSAANGQAIKAYQQAIESLSSARQSLLLIDPQVQFSFRDNVEPVYREFVALLLKTQLLEAQIVSQQALKQAVQTLDALQLTELENFLGCDLSQVVTLSTTGTDPQAVKIYPIVLPQQLAIIIEPPNQPLILKTVEVSEQTIETTLASLRENLTLPGKTPAVLKAARQLYDWLIMPVESVLAENQQIETLVFVPDGLLRNVPMGVLYDGEQYLIEKDYAIAVAPQLDLFTPRRSPSPLKVLRGGIGLPQTVLGQSFPPIELIQAELDQIPEQLTVSRPLINEAFTQSNIEKQLANETYSAIHWKTHGVFSSDPGETFLVAYQDGITANELSTLVRAASEQQAEPLELLVLSACETAQGDRRAVLGLAGMAVRAGTRSTLSTLWRADDGANTELMASFYQGLETGLTKAQSLQQAQQKLLNEVGYPAPYYWAPYVLVGNWL